MPPALKPEPSNRARARGYFGPLSLALLVFAGQFKANSALAWIPIDLTLVAAVAVAVAVVISRVQHGRTHGQLFVVSILWVSFLPGITLSPFDGYATTKLVTLFTITLLLVVAPFYLLRTPRQRTIFLSGVVGIGVLMTVLAIFFSQPDPNAYSNRLTLEGSNTIATGQIAGAAALVVLLTALVGNRPRAQRLVLAAMGVAFLSIALAAGSRGPILAAVTGFFVILIFSPGFRRYRGRAVFGAILLGGAAVWWATKQGSDGLLRVAGFFAGETDRSAGLREEFWTQSLQQISVSSFGIGWGNFSALRGEARYPHNLILEVTLEGGWIPGILLIIFIVASLVKLTRGSKSLDMFAICGLAVFSTINAMVSSDMNGDRLMWVTLSAGWVAVAELRSQENGLSVKQPTRARPLTQRTM